MERARTQKQQSPRNTSNLAAKLPERYKDVLLRFQKPDVRVSFRFMSEIIRGGNKLVKPVACFFETGTTTIAQLLACNTVMLQRAQRASSQVRTYADIDQDIQTLAFTR